MGFDASALSRLQNFSDYQRADQEFQMRKAQAAQQLEMGGIDQQAKKLSLLGQIVGNSSIDQPTYDKSRAYAQSVGIDTSGLPEQFNPDIVSRLRFAGATPTAQLSALIATQGHQLKAGIATGDVGAYGYGGGTTPAPTASTVDPTKITPAQARIIPPNGAVTSQTATVPAKTVTDIFTPDTLAPPVPPQPGDSTPITPDPLAFRPQKPNETTAAYEAALKAFQSSQQYQQGKADATEKGKLGAQNTEAAAKAEELTNRLKQNLDAMLKLNPDVPSGGILPASAKAYLSQAGAANGFGKGTGAIAADQWDQINNQQIISEIQQFVASGGANTRINQTLDKMIRAASGIDKNALPASREAQIKNALAEIENKNVSAGNLAGGNAQYQQIPVQSSSAPQMGATQQGTDGTYMFNGGDPSKPESWKKVK